MNKLPRYNQPLSIDIGRSNCQEVDQTRTDAVASQIGQAAAAEQLAEVAIHPWSRVDELRSSDKNVMKFVFTKDATEKPADHPAIVEAVLYKYPTYNDRTVICCSTQSGCPVGCRFCGTGDFFVRNLSTEEITAQPIHCMESQGINPEEVERLQIMFMSMGEPMLNQKQLLPAMRQLHERFPQAALLVSTSAPRVDYDEFRTLSQEIPTIGLQFSVHESTDDARNTLIPFEKKLTLAEIAREGELWAQATGRQPFFNYCVHDANGGDDDVDRLAALFDPAIWQATISVICERDESVSEANQRQRELASNFMKKMLRVGYSTRMFDPAGQDDIGGGCGQLWRVQEWVEQNPEYTRPSIGKGLPKLHMPK